MLGVRLQTQNNFIYGELGRTNLKCRRIVSVIKYWLKIIQLEDIKYVKIVYDLLYRELQVRPNKKHGLEVLKIYYSRLVLMMHGYLKA
jgi:hypothetical protein